MCDEAAAHCVVFFSVQGVVRNQAVRADMTGVQTADQKQFFDAMGTDSQTRRQIVQECSRHRAMPGGRGGAGAGPPPTPDGHWDAEFPESETQGSQ